MKSLLCLLFASLTALAAPIAHAQALQPPELAARQYVLLDLTTGQTLAERDADTATDRRASCRERVYSSV